MPRVVHFEINANDPERASSFYSDVFGWTITKWEGPMDYWLVMTGPEDEAGIDGGITRRMEPAMSTVNVVSVPSYDEYAAKILEKGGTEVSPKEALMGVGYVGYFKDTEDNAFGIIQMDENAQ